MEYIWLFVVLPCVVIGCICLIVLVAKHDMNQIHQQIVDEKDAELVSQLVRKRFSYNQAINLLALRKRLGDPAAKAHLAFVRWLFRKGVFNEGFEKPPPQYAIKKEEKGDDDA